VLSEEQAGQEDTGSEEREMNRTSIEWVKNPDGSQGFTWNPITGCLNNCEYCYARKLANGRLKQRYLAKKTWPLTAGLTDHPSADPFYPRFWPERLWLPRHYRKDSGIFPCDMSDLFGIGIPEEWTNQVIRVMELCSWHRFYLLTKQPQNLINFSPFPANIWCGVTVTNDAMLTLALTELGHIEATVKYLSIEPLLGSLQPPIDRRLSQAGINGVIIGAQTKPTIYPNPRWVHEIIVACREAGIPYFLKDNLAGCLPKEAPYYRMPGYLVQKEGFSYVTDKPILIQELPL